MCGIVGIVYPENREPVDPAILRLMNNSLRHRGPDDEGYWIDRNVGLAMRRLSIIDLEGGHQPISNETGDVWTVFNGEIYNFSELREDLMKRGHRFETHTDTEVIVHLYEEEGESFVQKLRGMFTIALWDARARKLLLYRDRVGIKPLHYWFQNGNLLFASEIKALLEHPKVGREISLSALSDYLSFLYIPTPKTIYQDIFKLPPGHFLRYQNGSIKIESYWDFSYPTDTRLKEEDWIERLKATLEESVRMHLISDVPVGAFLSGGMDSSTIVAWMSRQNAGPVKTYSIGFHDDRFNELPYARQVAKHFGTDHHEKMVQADGFELLPKILSGFDEPFADSSAIPTYFVSEFARQGVTVALSGDGGDELFGGYLWTRKELWLEKYRSLPSFLKRAIHRAFLKKDFRPLRETNAWSNLQRFLYDASLKPWQSFSRRAMSFQPWMKQDLLQDWVQKELSGEDSSDCIRSLFEKGVTSSQVENCLYADSKVYLPDDLLTKVDRMSMLHSLEVRVPLLDHKVIELACSIPLSLKIKGRTTKYILKQAMKDKLPAGILTQRKQGFSIPLQKWFRKDLYATAQKFLLSDNAFSRRYFNSRSINTLLEEHRSGRQNFGSQLYALLVFEIWGRIYQESKNGASASACSLKDIV